MSARPGKFELADGATLFLDEIGDMAPETQARILRVLQEGEVFRIGGSKARVGEATHSGWLPINPLGTYLPEWPFSG